MSVEIHWHEGLFLQPHHLQRMQRTTQEQRVADRKLGWAYPYGLIEARWSRDELENMRIRFERLRAIMPSGQVIDYPYNAELPALDIKQALAKSVGGFKLYLGVPLWQNDRANTLSTAGDADTRARLLYRVNEVECRDENTGDNPKPIQVRKINSRLMFENEDPTEMDLLPLMRVVRAAGEDVGLPRQDADYVPPCFVLSGSPVLRELVRDLVAQVEATRSELVQQLTRSGFSIDTMRGAQFVQMLRLRTLNRFSGRLPSLIQTPQLSPFEMYLELRELLGELAGLHPDRDKFDCAPYDHDNPYPVFKALAAAIRDLLKGEVLPSYLRVVFRPSEDIHVATLADEMITQPNAYLLAIKTKLDPTVLARDVQDGDKFKLMPQSLIRKAIRGVELKYEHVPPMGLPVEPDLHYFRLDRASVLSSRMWQTIQTEKSAAIRWTGSQLDWTGATFTLFGTIPVGGPTRP